MLTTEKETQKKRVQKTTTTAAKKHKIVARKFGAKVVKKWCAESASTHVEPDHVALRIMATCRAGHCARLGAAQEEFGLTGSHKFLNG